MGYLFPTWPGINTGSGMLCALGSEQLAGGLLIKTRSLLGKLASLSTVSLAVRLLRNVLE